MVCLAMVPRGQLVKLDFGIMLALAWDQQWFLKASSSKLHQTGLGQRVLLEMFAGPTFKGSGSLVGKIPFHHKTGLYLYQY